MKIAHCQLRCTPGDLKANIAKVLAGLDDAEREGADIVSFPETFLTGYFKSADKTRANALALDGPEITTLIEKTASYSPTWMIGFIELRDDALHNTVLVAEKGRILGTYSKAFPCFDFFTPGREFPVFERDGVTFGVIICADGGYIEPARILALKGAQIIFAPHYNYIEKEHLLDHFMKVRSDHIARAVENGVWFVRGNNVSSGPDDALEADGVGYGDSYLLDPHGEVIVRARRDVEVMITSRIELTESPPGSDRSLRSGRELGEQLLRQIRSAE